MQLDNGDDGEYDGIHKEIQHPVDKAGNYFGQDPALR